VTRAALLGGGAGNPRPGAVSLAHHGVLFLDEASEVSARVLDGLRAPLVTRAALLGGGAGNPRPGAVSLAHHGVLFLDEA
ncbi:ATP-binding protein, partial [Bacteroides fragilis]|nr:ATP-binding protein [Bacteroides fragilis]